MLVADGSRQSLNGSFFACTLFDAVSFTRGLTWDCKLTKRGKKTYRGICELLEVAAWQDQASMKANAWNWLRYRPAAAVCYVKVVQRVAHLILYHLLDFSWHSWTTAWLLMPLFYYAIIPDELHWLLDLVMRMSCWMVFRLQKQPAAAKRVLVAPGIYGHVPGQKSVGPKDGPQRHMQMWSSATCLDPSFGLRSQQLAALAARPPNAPHPPDPADSPDADSPVRAILRHLQHPAVEQSEEQQEQQHQHAAAQDAVRVNHQLQVLAAVCKASYETPRVLEEVILPKWSDAHRRVTLYAAFKFRRRYHHHRPAEPSGDFTAYILNIGNEAIVMVFRVAQAWSQIPWYLRLDMARLADPGKMGIQAHAGLLEVLGLTSNLADIKRNSKRGTCAGFQATRCRKGTMRWETLCRGQQGANLQTPYLLLLKELTNLAATPGMPATAPLYVTGHCMGEEEKDLLVRPQERAHIGLCPSCSQKAFTRTAMSILPLTAFIRRFKSA
ncbi:hypothetical protein WJX84_011422 [Apatococcus fuscideae]|uniref:Uncharacterized protein n=1 Tax=Apatococcus fuscideae TaxID=2026836 RepID=A0AAW1SXC9_9CHLO